MLKRTLSGIMAAVLLFLSIPFSAFADTTLTEAEQMQITTKWMTEVYKSGMDSSDDAKGLTFEDISVKNAIFSGESETYITLMPFYSDTNVGVPTFDHVKFGELPSVNSVSSLEISEVNGISAGKFMDSVKNNHADIGHVGAGASHPEADPDDDAETYYYGSIGIKKGEMARETWPVYAWYDVSKATYSTIDLSVAVDNNWGTLSAWHASCLYYISDTDRTSDNKPGNDAFEDIDNMSKYAVDTLSLYLFIAKMHCLFHNKSSWDAVGMSEEYKKMDEVLHFSDYKEFTGCSSNKCPLLTALCISTDKGRHGDTDGRNNFYLSAQEIVYPHTYDDSDAKACTINDNGTVLSKHLNYNFVKIGYVGYTSSSAGSTVHRFSSCKEHTSVIEHKYSRSELEAKVLDDLGEASGLTDSSLYRALQILGMDVDCTYSKATYSDKFSQNLQKYTLTVMYEHGFLNSPTDILGGDCRYIEELEDLLSWSHPVSGSNNKSPTDLIIESLIFMKNVSADVGTIVTKANEKAEEKSADNRVYTPAGMLKCNGKQIPSSLLPMVPYVIYPDGANNNISNPQAFTSAYTAVATKINSQIKECNPYGGSQTVASRAGITDINDGRDSIIVSLGELISTAESFDSLTENIVGDVYVKSNWTEGSSTNSYYTDWISKYIGTNKEAATKFVKDLIKDAVTVLNHDDYKVAEDAKLKFLHCLWTALYDEGGSLYNDTEIIQIVEKYFPYASNATITSESVINQYKVQWDISKTTKASESLEGGTTLELRSDIIDTYAKYGLAEDDFIREIMDYTKSILKNHNQKVVPNSVCLFEPMNYETANKYFYYQMLLLEEAYVYSTNVYTSLIFSVLENGVTLENNGYALTTLCGIKAVTDKYRGVKAESIWYDNIGTNSDEDSELNNLSGLYDYLLKLGLISSSEYVVKIYDEDDPITSFWTQTGGNITFSPEYYEGRVLSATYIPMQTNVYDPYSMLDYTDLDWIEDFHYKYGFHRKALMIDTNVDSATDSYISHTQGATRIATLEDLFNCERDIVLYVDEHFYGLTELAELQDKTYDRLASTNPSLWESIVNSVSDMFSMFSEVDFDVALKHTEDMYSYEIANNVSDMTWVPPTGDNNGSAKKYDQYILKPSAIKQYIGSTSYTPMMGYAVVSNIYRNSEAYNTIAKISSERTPVFESSPTLATITGASRTAENTLYNYALLKNLKDMSTVGYETSTDMTSPIYCDIYGNIVTESGLVVIPAACNATLHNGNSTWQPIATGFLSTYGSSWSIPSDWNLDPEFMNQMFIKNEDTGVWDIRNKTIQNVDINFAQLSYSDKAVNTALKEMYFYDLYNGGQINQYNSLNVLHETLRGAPLENIDFDAENLNSARRVDKSGLIAAAKLDNIVNSIDWDDENSLMSIPRLSFIDNYQYVVVFIFKVLFVIIVTALMLTVYIDALKASISFKTAGRCVLTLVLGVASVLLIPVSYDISYYQSNKMLLQDEAEYIMMLNTEKHMSGREIGVYEVTEPKANTQILIKLEDFEFNWVSELPNVIFSDSINIMDEKYQEFLDNSLIAGADNVQAMNDGMYMDIQDIFDTSVLNFSTSSKQLYQKVSVDPVASYYMPYYYFLDALLTNMNDYNRSNNIYAYSTKIMRGGAVKTVNLCDSYFSSKEFMESSDTDYLGLYQLYDTMGSMYILPIFDSESVEQARGSQWYVGTLMKEEDRLERIELMTQKVREYVTENRDLIGKVTDETFLKCMAMSLALEYNDIFGIPSASALEIYNLSNADLMRLSVADKAATLEGSPMSFSRFVYNEAGTPGVYAGVFLVIITMFVQTMKTVVTLAIMALLIISVYVFKILLRKSTNSIGGYLLTLLIICSTNILYAFILKLSLYIPQTGLAPTLCIIIQILIQLGYLIILCVVLSFALRDWKNFGFTHYQNIGTKIKNKFSNVFRGRHNRTPQQRYDSEPRGKDGWEYYRNLVKENERRMKKVGN